MAGSLLRWLHAACILLMMHCLHSCMFCVGPAGKLPLMEIVFLLEREEREETLCKSIVFKSVYGMPMTGAGLNRESRLCWALGKGWWWYTPSELSLRCGGGVMCQHVAWMALSCYTSWHDNPACVDMSRLEPGPG